MLEYYSSKLNSVEVNSTFYHMPSKTILPKWKASTQDDFKFSLKANRKITHIKKLRDAKPEVSYFLGAAASLETKLGCILVQLPPYQRCDPELLEGFLAESPTPSQFALEFRHESWFKPEVYNLLEKYGAALCIAETEEVKPVLQRTASFHYARLRREKYAQADLRAWASRLHEHTSGSDDCYVYFKHDEAGEAARLATEFRGML